MGGFARGIALACALAVCSLVGAAGAAQPAAGDIDRETILVQFADAGAGSSLARLRGDVLTDRLRQGLGVIRLTGGLSVEQAVAVYSRLPGVLYAEPNGIARATVSAPNDPSFASQWNLARVRAVEGWTAYPGVYASGGGATIAVLDTGVQASHPDLDQNVLSGVTCLDRVVRGRER